MLHTIILLIIIFWRVIVLSDIELLERLYELVKANQYLIVQKTRGEHCITIKPYFRRDDGIMEMVLDEIEAHHNQDNQLTVSRGSKCLRVCIRQSYKDVMSDSIHQHHYAEMEE